jgi:hypothetical protein
VAGLLVIATALLVPGGGYVGPAAVYFVAIPHYLSTFTFYLGDDQLAYYKTRWVAFFVGPFVCCAVVMATILSKHAAIFQTGQFTWNVYHVALQSAGILSLYRGLNDGPARERRVAKVAILSVGASMAFYRPERFAAVHDTLSALHRALPGLISPVAAAVAAVSLAMLAHAVARRPRPIALPEGVFLATSLLLFHPYLWVENTELATLGMLMGHFVQYLAVVWLLHHRKYGWRSSGSLAQRLLESASRSGPRIVGVLVACGLLVFVIDRSARLAGIPGAYQAFWNVIVIMHFYLDGLIWTFRRPYVRESIGSYLVLDDHRVA